jgi:signal transduction histidine kinase
MAKRTSLAVLSVLLFALLSLGFPLLRSIEYGASEEIARTVDQDGWLLATAISPSLTKPNEAEIERIIADAVGDQDLAVVVQRADGSSVYDSARTTKQSTKQRQVLTAALAGALRGKPYPATRTGSSTRVVSAVPIADQGRVVGAIGLSYLDRSVVKRTQQRRSVLLIVGLTGAALAVLFSLMLSRWITRPVRRLQTAARTFATGELSKLDEPDSPSSKGPREVRDLAETMELMAKQLDITLVRHRSFLANASHQLRSPLTAIALRLDNLRDRIGEDPERDQKDLSIMHSSLHDLSSQLDQLVRLAKTDHDSLEERVPIRAIALLAERKTLWEDEAKRRSIDLVVLDSHDEVTIFATPGRIAQAFDNLITNAIDASPPGSSIELVASMRRTVARNDGARPGGARVAMAELRVIDHGIGMSSDKRQRAFQLYATDKPSDRGLLGGTGLGLSLVQLLVLADRGSVTLEETANGGTTAVISMPLAAMAKA